MSGTETPITHRPSSRFWLRAFTRLCVRALGLSLCEGPPPGLRSRGRPWRSCCRRPSSHSSCYDWPLCLRKKEIIGNLFLGRARGSPHLHTHVSPSLFLPKPQVIEGRRTELLPPSSSSLSLSPSLSLSCSVSDLSQDSLSRLDMSHHQAMTLLIVVVAVHTRQAQKMLLLCLEDEIARAETCARNEQTNNERKRFAVVTSRKT